MIFLFTFESSYITSLINLKIMGFPTKIQLIKRKASEQWYINFPSAVAQAMEFEKGEVVEWVVKDKHQMMLKRKYSEKQEVKKTVLKT